MIGDDAASSAITYATSLAHGLFPHQVEGIAFLLRRRRAILADDMGLGKTRQAIVALRTEEPGGPYLVVCPASVKRNWAREIGIAHAGATTQIISGKSDDSPLTAEWVIVNYDILGAHAARLAGHPWRGIVFDEAHYIKNHTSQRSKNARALVAAARDPLVYLLTGTPLTNRPRDLFPLLQLCGHALGRSFLSFAKRYCAAYQNEYGWVTDGASNLDELAVQLHGIMLRRSKDDVLELPPKLRTWLSVDVPRGTGAREIGNVVRMMLESEKPDDGRRRPDDVALRGRLLGMITIARQRLASAKTPHTIEFVENAVAQGEKVIVFTCFEDPILKLHERFGDAAVVLTGKTPSAQRQSLVDRFQQDDSVRVFIANIIAGGIGFNLTAARHVVFNDLDWVPANHWQAEDRAYRIGQTNTVHVTYMIGTETIDEFVQQLLQLKADIVDAVVEGRALEAGFGANVLEEMQRLLHAMSPHLADVNVDELDDRVVSRVLRDAAAAAEKERNAKRVAETDVARRTRSQAMEQALRLLAQALSTPHVRKYRIASGSHPGQYYDLSVDHAGDVICSCPGFEYRGMCTHARTLKHALATGRELPRGYHPVAA